MQTKLFVFFICLVPIIGFTYGAVISVMAMSNRGTLTPVFASWLIGTAIAGAMYVGYTFGRRFR